MAARIAAKSWTLHRMSTSLSSWRRSRGKPASSRCRASAWSAPLSRCSILKRCDLVGGYFSAEGCASARSRNSRASPKIRRTSGEGWPGTSSSEAPWSSGLSANMAGSSSNASADITAAAPVSSRQRSASPRFSMPPLAITGILTARRTAAISFQLGVWSTGEPPIVRSAYFGRCFAVRPCTQRAAAPASSMAKATSTVLLLFSSRRILAVTGTEVRPPATVLTIRFTSGMLGRRYAPNLRQRGEC
mmetsp:Transcript_91360/g.254428  ORF Transcript_91360/g.254428 Transcript_91360/m.254428 type:complete len:246 (-) Transcript_91360:839-1576(-)